MFASLLAKPAVLLGLVVVGLLALAVIARNWSCKPVKPPRPERTHTETGIVASVDTAVQFTLEQGGRRKRLRPVQIRWVASDGSPSALALASTLMPLGASVSVEAVGGRFLGDIPEDATDEATEPLEARGPLVGVVKNSNGQDVGLELVSKGLAKCEADSPPAYIAAEKQAVKRKGK